MNNYNVNVFSAINMYYTQKRLIFAVILTAIIAITYFSFYPIRKAEMLSYTFDFKAQNLALYWKDDKGIVLKNIGNLNTYVESKNQKLVFAMNAGMYKKDNQPLGLFIKDGHLINPLNLFKFSDKTKDEIPNFYLQPNGVFYITFDNKAYISKTKSFVNNSVRFATQSGPMLLIDGQINPTLKQGSRNYNIRNGVGILPDNKVIFAISKGKINFYDFALYFKNLGCSNALFLDGYVSRAYLPQKNYKQTDGNFGVMIGVTEPKDSALNKIQK